MQNNTYLEAERVEVLNTYELIGQPELPEDQECLKELTELAAAICGTPIALITLLDNETQWFKAKHGLDGEQTKKEDSFCQYTIRQNGLFEVYDAQADDRFMDNPYVKGEPYVRFYLGAPLVNEDGYSLGSMCVIDHVPRQLTDKQKNALRILAQQVINNFELRKKKRILESHAHLLEEQVKQRTTELNRFVYSASHELRAPLKSILGLTALAQSELARKEFESQGTYLYLIEKSTHKLDSTINDLINYSKNSEQDVIIECISLSELIEKITSELTYYNPSMEIDLQVDIQEDILFYSDRTRVSMVLSNIISNAFKYQDVQKDYHSIHVQITNDTDKSTIVVQDNGIGIEQEFIDKIFSMFFRAISDREGVGLGLYIVREALLKLKGTCEVYSTIGEGTTFKIILPNQSDQAKANL